MSRIDKINKQVTREVSRIVHEELSDPRVEFVTITRSDVSPDLHNARVYFSVLGDRSQVDGAQMSLDGASSMIRKLVAQRMKIRYTPSFQFIYDGSIEFSAKIEQAIMEIKEENEKSSPTAQDE